MTLPSFRIWSYAFRDLQSCQCVPLGTDPSLPGDIFLYELLGYLLRLFLLEIVGHASFDVRGPSFSFRPFVRGVLGLIGSFSLPSLQKLVVSALYPSAHDYTSAFC